MLPPDGWDQVATKLDSIETTCNGLAQNLKSFRAEWKSDLGALRAEVKSDLGTLRAELKREIDVSRVTSKGDLEALEYKLSADFRKEILGQTRTIIFAVVGILIPYAGVILAAARLT